MSPVVAAVLGVLTVVLALAPAVCLALAPGRSMVTVGLGVACAVAYEFLLFRVGAWAFSSVHLRGVACVAVLLGALVAVARSARRAGAKRGPVRFLLAMAAVLACLDGWALSASWYSELPLDAHLPLATGTYCVMQGGNSVLTNPFHGKALELAAIDIVKLTSSGNRAMRFVPNDLADYGSFGAPILSPCDGEVIATEAALPDSPPGSPDEAHASGNHVVVRCAAGIVKLAHAQHASVLVSVGERVHVGQRLASIGNSGGTSEPHLHVGAYPLGTPMDLVIDHSGDMPIRLDGRFLVANAVLTVP